MGRTKIIVAVVLIGAACTAILALAWAGNESGALEGAEAQFQAAGTLPALNGATTWINSKPLTPAQLRGKVVLVNFWTYSCINSLRQIPYVRAWAEKYRDKGLVVIGVHAPEFAFEYDTGNVRRSLDTLGVGYPIAVDSAHAIWNAFRNEYWPAIYVVDAKGRIRYRKFGEGDYAQLEMVIQQLLTEAGAEGIGHELVSVDARGAEAEADWTDLQSPETYAGYARTERFSSPGGVERDQSNSYALPDTLRLNHWGLAGAWTMGSEATVLRDAAGKIAYRFHARDFHLVMGPTYPSRPIRFRVSIDGRPPGDSHGLDVDSEGNGVVSESRMYQLIRQQMPVMDRQFEIEFLDPGVKVFAFTFG